MRVDLRLKLAREIRPKKTAGAAVREGDDEGGGAVRQRDVFHVKGEFFEQKFYASFVMATRRRSPPLNDANRTRVHDRSTTPALANAAAPRRLHLIARYDAPRQVPLARVPAKSDEEIDEAFDRARARYGGGSKVWAQAGRSTSAPAGRGRGWARRRGTEGTPRSGSHEPARASGGALGG